MMDDLLDNFRISGWKRILYLLIFILLMWQLTKFYGAWKNGVTSIFYVIHAPVHEIGHAVAGHLRLPQTWIIAAGSIFQEMTPVSIGIYFLFQGDFPAISLCIGWLGFSTIEMAAYMYDAPFRGLNLVVPFGQASEDAHDFANLFAAWNCMGSACRIGEICAAIGYFLVLAAILLIAVMLICSFLPQGMERLGSDH